MKNLSSEIPHLIVLFACMSLLAASFILRPPSEENPYLRLGRVALPEICTFHNLTGFPCPGCGLSRSMVAAAHGDFQSSLAFHRLGILTLVYLFVQASYRSVIIAIPSPNICLLRGGKILDKGLIVLGFLFFINWVITLMNRLLV
ncbi:MAG: DUF2752 domain-containing protein [Candidatus Aminicenantes bacterium]|nr:DUF2752 domain-containing protein [Candidatus Aminicenantes bacterium]